jgi:hypothetical protein
MSVLHAAPMGSAGVQDMPSAAQTPSFGQTAQTLPQSEPQTMVVQSQLSFGLEGVLLQAVSAMTDRRTALSEARGMIAL